MRGSSLRSVERRGAAVLVITAASGFETARPGTPETARLLLYACVTDARRSFCAYSRGLFFSPRGSGGIDGKGVVTVELVWTVALFALGLVLIVKGGVS